MYHLPGAIQERYHRVFAPIVNWLCRLLLHRVEVLSVRMHIEVPPYGIPEAIVCLLRYNLLWVHFGGIIYSIEHNSRIKAQPFDV